MMERLLRNGDRMTEKRFTIKSQDDYFGITDNNTVDKVNVINGIHTEIEAKWLCDLLNALHEENEELKNAIIGKIQYGEDLEKFAIEKGLIQEDWARFDDYD